MGSVFCNCLVYVLAEPTCFASSLTLLASMRKHQVDTFVAAALMASAVHFHLHSPAVLQNDDAYEIKRAWPAAESTQPRIESPCHIISTS